MAAAQVLEMTALVQVKDDGQQYAAVIPTERMQAIFAGDGLEQITAKVRELAMADPAASDPELIQTAKGRAAIKSLAYKVTRTKTALDEAGKALVADLKELPKRIDANRKAMREDLDALAEEIRKPLTLWEQETKALSDRLNWIDNLPTALANASSEEVTEAYARTVIFEPVSPEAWGPFYEEAKAIIPRVNRAMAELFKARKKAEDDAAELERLRREQVERQRKDAEERRIREAAETAAREAEARAERERQAALGREAEAKRQAELAEQRRIEAEKRAQEAERLAAEHAERARKQAEEAERAAQERADRARQDAIEAEHRRATEEAERKRLEEEKRRADQENFQRVNREALEDIAAAIHTIELATAVNGDAIAKAVATAIIKGQIRHVAISY